MSILTIVLRILAVLAFAGLTLLTVRWSHRQAKTRATPDRVDRAPMAANFTALGLLFLSLFFFSASSAGLISLLLALSGALLALAGAALVVICHGQLGAAWSFVPKADPSTGLSTGGPYSLVRHPMYLGLTLLAVGQAVAFGSWPALFIALLGVVPTLAWRARAEEQLLSRTFGESFDAYRERTKMIVPYVL
jgi:protein-S-isoprenylcysteine O-methyltransferase Ste14